MWRQIISWPTVLVASNLLVALGFGVLSMSPPEVKVAIGFFTAGYLIIVAKIATWAIFEITGRIWEKGCFVLLIFIAGGLLWFFSSMFALSKQFVYPQVLPHLAGTSGIDLSLSNPAGGMIQDVKYRIRKHVQRNDSLLQPLPEWRDLGVVTPFTVLPMETIVLSDEPEDVYQIDYLTTGGKFSEMLYFTKKNDGIEVKYVATDRSGAIRKQNTWFWNTVAP